MLRLLRNALNAVAYYQKLNVIYMCRIQIYRQNILCMNKTSQANSENNKFPFIPLIILLYQSLIQRKIFNV